MKLLFNAGLHSLFDTEFPATIKALPDVETEVSERKHNMETHPQARKMQLLWICLSLGLAAGATVSGKVDNPVPEEPLHRSKRTMTTICVEIRPSGPQEEPYYMCRGANFGAESGQQGCVEVRNQGGGQEPVYMCQGMEPTKSPALENNQQVLPQPGSVHTFPSFPAFGGGSSYPHNQFAEHPIHQFPPPPPPSPPTSYQEQSSHPQPLPQQPQAHGQTGHYGHPVAAHSAAPAAHPHGLPSVPYPIAGSAPAAPSGAPDGPGAAATSPPYDPAAGQGPANRPNKEYGILGSSRHSGFEGEVFAVPDVGFRTEELHKQYRRPVTQHQHQDQLMWVPVSQSADPENDPVMRAFYGSLAGAGSQGQESASVPADNRKEDPMVGQGAPYTPFNSQYPELAPPSAPAYAQADMSPSPTPSTPYCNGCSVQCPPPADNGMSYSTSCPSFQPVIITMPTCYGQQQPQPQPQPYYSMPRAAPGILQRPAPPLGAPFGLAPAPVANPFGGGAFGMNAQMGSPFGMSQGYGMDQQVGGPFGMGMQLGMGLNPFGPFGTLNPFNPFNRILGAAAPTPPAPTGNFFQRVLKFNPNDFAFSTTEASPIMETSTTKGSGKLNFATSTATPSTSEKPPSAAVSDARSESEEEEDDSVEEDDGEEQLATTILPPEDLDKSEKELTARQFVSKAADLLKPEKRKRHNSRSSSSRVAQKHRYLQQL